MHEEATLKAAYEAASVAYRRIADKNATRLAMGELPTVEELQREDDAQNRLAIARRAYMNWLSEL